MIYAKILVSDFFKAFECRLPHAVITEGNILYLSPIINGMWNYYVETQTRNEERMDVIVDYPGEQYVVELKNLERKYLL